MDETYEIVIEFKPTDVLYLCPDLSLEDAKNYLSNLEYCTIDGGSAFGLKLLTKLLQRDGYFVLPRFNDVGIP